MKTGVLTVMVFMCTTVAAAPPPGLSSALVAWASPRPVERYQFSQVDLNADGALDAVVLVTDSRFCGGGGCPLVAFTRKGDGYELVASSGNARKPVYALEETRGGWRTLAAVVGFGASAGIVPIRYKTPPGAYRSMPIVEPQLELKTPLTKYVLPFEEATLP